MAASVLGCRRLLGSIVADALDGDDICGLDRSENHDCDSLTVHDDRTKDQVQAFPEVVNSKESIGASQTLVRVEPDGDCKDGPMKADAKKNVKGPRRVESDCEGQEQIADGHLEASS